MFAAADDSMARRAIGGGLNPLKQEALIKIVAPFLAEFKEEPDYLGIG